MAKVAERGIRIQYDSERKIRARNKLHYRFNHWPIWITVFFLVPGPLTFDLFERGFDWRMSLWLACVLIGTGIAGIRGKLPGCEAAPYIIRFTEDKPNPLYRRVCYTFAWGAVISYAVLNLTGLITALATGQWMLKQIYQIRLFPAGRVWYGYWVCLVNCRVCCPLRKVRDMNAATSTDRFGLFASRSQWWVCSGSGCRKRTETTWLKLIVFVVILAFMGTMAYFGRLPRTAPIVPGQLAVSD